MAVRYNVITDAPPEPNLESGANIDCCKLYRDNKAVSQQLPICAASFNALTTRLPLVHFDLTVMFLMYDVVVHSIGI